MAEINLASLRNAGKMASNIAIALAKKMGAVHECRAVIQLFETSDGETLNNGMYFSVEKYRCKIAYLLEGIRQNLIKLNRFAALIGEPPVLEGADYMSRTTLYRAMMRFYRQVDEKDDIELWVDTVSPGK